MQHINRILFVDDGVTEANNCLSEAVRLAVHQNAQLDYLIVHPPLPTELEQYKKTWEEAFEERATQMLNLAKSLVSGAESLVVHHHTSFGDHLAVDVTAFAKQISADLVVKPYKSNRKASGPDAADLNLLRHCPAPVGLFKEHSDSVPEGPIMVAIDPESDDEPFSEQLNTELLSIAEKLAKGQGKDLVVVSCWDYAYEYSLKNSAFISIPSSEVDEAVKKCQKLHRERLDALLQSSGVEVSLVKHERGAPEAEIPKLAAQLKVDKLVIGTVARSGLSGLLMGNTAENIVNRVNASIIAVKPCSLRH